MMRSRLAFFADEDEMDRRLHAHMYVYETVAGGRVRSFGPCFYRKKRELRSHVPCGRDTYLSYSAGPVRRRLCKARGREREKYYPEPMWQKPACAKTYYPTLT